MARKAAAATRRDRDVQPQHRSEIAWNAMISPEHDERDRWSDVEEQLLQGQEQKRWKYDAR